MNRFVTYIFQRFVSHKEVSYWGLVRKHSAHHSQDIECRPLELAVVLDNGHKAVGDNCNIDLHPYSILGIAPEGGDSGMLLYPSKEQFHLTSLLVQQGYVAGLERKVVGQERERSLQFRSIVNNSPESTRILLPGLVARKAYRLIKQNIIRTVKQVFTVNNLIVEMGLLSDDKERVNDVDPVQSGKVIIAFVNDADYFPEAVATGKLSKHHHKKLVPASEILDVPVSTVLLDDAIKYSLSQKNNELTEKIFPTIHAVLDYIQTVKMVNQFKLARDIFAYN